VIPALRRLRQESREFKASLAYVVRLCLIKIKRKREKRNDEAYFIIFLIS
jgi:hypothetical protein